MIFIVAAYIIRAFCCSHNESDSAWRDSRDNNTFDPGLSWWLNKLSPFSTCDYSGACLASKQGTACDSLQLCYTYKERAEIELRMSTTNKLFDLQLCLTYGPQQASLVFIAKAYLHFSGKCRLCLCVCGVLLKSSRLSRCCFESWALNTELEKAWE